MWKGSGDRIQEWEREYFCVWNVLRIVRWMHCDWGIDIDDEVLYRDKRGI